MSKLDELIRKFCPDDVEYKRIKELAEIGTGRSNGNEAEDEGIYPFFIRSQTVKRKNDWEYDEEAIIIPGEGGIGDIYHYVNGKYAIHQRVYRIHFINESINVKFAFHYFMAFFKSFILQRAVSATVKSIRKPMIEDFQIPVPPLEVQCKIARILDNFTELSAELKARKKQYEFYRDKLLNSQEEVPIFRIDQISENCDRKRRPVTKQNRTSGQYPYYGASGIVDYVSDYIFDGDYLLISEDGANLLTRNTPIAFSISGKTWVNNHAHVLKFDNYELRRYVEIYLNSIDLSKYISGGAQPKLNQENLNKIEIPVPDTERLKYVVNILDRFDYLCNDISNGLPAEIEARKKQYKYYRDKLLTFPEKKTEGGDRAEN